MDLWKENINIEVLVDGQLVGKCIYCPKKKITHNIATKDTLENIRKVFGDKRHLWNTHAHFSFARILFRFFMFGDYTRFSIKHHFLCHFCCFKIKRYFCRSNISHFIFVHSRISIVMNLPKNSWIPKCIMQMLGSHPTFKPWNVLSLLIDT